MAYLRQLPAGVVDAGVYALKVAAERFGPGDEVAGLLRDIKGAWESIGTAV